MRLQHALLTLFFSVSSVAYGIRSADGASTPAELKARSVISQLPQIVSHCTQAKNPCHLHTLEYDTLVRIKFHFQLNSMVLMLPTEKPTSYEFLTHTLYLNSQDLQTNETAKAFAAILNLTLNTLATDAMEQDGVHYDFSFLKEESKSIAVPESKLTLHTTYVKNSKTAEHVSQGLVLANEKTHFDLTQHLTEVLQCPNPQWKLSHIETNKHRSGIKVSIEWNCRLSRYKAELHVSRFPDDKLKLKIKRKMRFY